MKKQTYQEQLLDPRWQRVRLKRLESANWKCEACQNGEKTLHVHHRQYIKGRMAWEYGDAQLQVLCKDCHNKGHKTKDALARLLSLKFAADASVEELTYGFLCGFLMSFGDVEESDFELAIELEPRFFGLGVMIAALGPRDIVAAVRKKLDEGRLESGRKLVEFALKFEEEEPE